MEEVGGAVSNTRIAMHEKRKEVSKKFGVKKAEQRVVGSGKWRGERFCKGAFFSAKESQARAFDRRSALRVSLLSV